MLERYRNSPAHKYINSSQLEEDLKEAAKNMTNKKAIEILKRNKPISDPRKCGKELCTAVDKAIEALEKQIPKKIIYHDNCGNPSPYQPRCPRCYEASNDTWIYAGESYCEYCGQAIDWSE